MSDASPVTVAPATFVLASASPRRRDLLASLGLTFDVAPADVDETPTADESPVFYVERVAADKARAVASAMPGIVVLAADTTVDLDGRILAKPLDEDDARAMLTALSGRTHQVHTAVVGIDARGGRHAVTVTTDVTFAPLAGATIDWYLALGEHADKAGAYGMQGAAGAFVSRIDGSGSNVIGLPLVETIDVLRACGLTVAGCRTTA